MEFDAVGGAYANALVEIAQENNSLDDVHADVDALQSLFSDNEQIKDFLFNPVMTPEKKRDVVKKISKEAGLSKYTTNFLNLLIDKDRIQAIEEILEAFEQTYCKMTDTQVSLTFQSLHAQLSLRLHASTTPLEQSRLCVLWFMQIFRALVWTATSPSISSLMSFGCVYDCHNALTHMRSNEVVQLIAAGCNSALSSQA